MSDDDMSTNVLPDRTQVLIAGGAPVGLAAAVELGQCGITCVVIEPRATVSHARPRCKTISIRSMEHLRRWGIADRLRERAPLPVAWSQDIVFYTSLIGHELSRFSGVLGLTPEDGRSRRGRSAGSPVRAGGTAARCRGRVAHGDVGHRSAGDWSRSGR